MRFSYAMRPFEDEGPAPSEIASLAFKFRSDNSYDSAHDRQDWLCAELLLTQREWIRRQVAAGRHRRMFNGG